MAKYQIERSCGHYETVNISGPYKARESRVEYEEGRLCRECYTAKVDAERDAAAAAAAEQAEASGLPALQGSEKQIRWAEQIRAEIIGGAGEGMASLAEVRETVAANADAPGATEVAQALDELEAQASAGWWIDNKAITALSWAKKRARELMAD